MTLTTEQRAQIERQRSASPQCRSFQVTMTPAQRQEYRAAVAEELAGRDANLDHVREVESAEREPTLSGSLRRAISDSGRSTRELSSALQIDADLLTAFRTGSQSLPSDVIDRLIELLDLDVIVADVTQ